MFKEITILIVSALLTMTIELIVLEICKVKDERLWLSLLFNFGTNLLLNGALSLCSTKWLYYFFVIIGEILVFLIEWFFLNLIKKDNKNWLYSLIMNTTSFLLGSGIVYLLFSFV